MRAASHQDPVRAMRPPHIAMLLIALLAAFGTRGAHAAVDPQAWRVVQSIGDVAISAPDTTISRPKAGTVLPPQSVIITGRNGRAILSRKGQQIVVQPNTRLELSPDRGEQTVLQQLRGVAIFSVDHRKAPHFEVNTPYLAANVKGTRFEVRVTDNDAEINVFEGKVEVRSNISRAATLVTPGALARITEDMPETIRLRERSGKTRDVTVNEGSLGTGEMHVPDLRTNAPDYKVSVEISGSGNAGSRRAPVVEGFDADNGTPASPRPLGNTAPRLRLTGDTNAATNVQETELRFSNGVARNPNAPPARDLFATGDKSMDDRRPEQPTAPPANAPHNSGDLFRQAGRNSFELPGISTRNSFLNTHRLSIHGEFPWWEVGIGAFAIMSLLGVTAIRGWIRRRKARQRRNEYDY